MLDPADWEDFRRAAHTALDEALDFLRDVRERPVWQPVPASVKEALQQPLPQQGSSFESVYREFAQTIMPYVSGNVHPRFWGWVHGCGTPGGAVAELLAAVMNANVGGRDHGAVYVERTVIAWFATLFGMPHESSGIVVTGTSAANLLAVIVARTNALCETGDAQLQRKLTGYASSATHVSVRKAFSAAGLDPQALRILPADDQSRLPVDALAEAIDRDRRAGLTPFFIAANAGTVDTGAIDQLADLAAIAREQGLWFHIDGAFGAAAALSQRLRSKLRGIEHADSLAFDFHKWLHVPYDAGCLLVRSPRAHRAAFSLHPAYLKRMERGLAAGEPWFADYGIELSRGFRALKIWFTLKEHGAAALAAAIERNCDQAHYLRTLIERDPLFELAAPVELQIVCFYLRASGGLDDAARDRLTDEIVVRLQESGVAVISSTTIGGRRAMRVCITNHRTRESDLDMLVRELRVLLRRALEEPA